MREREKKRRKRSTIGRRKQTGSMLLFVKARAMENDIFQICKTKQNIERISLTFSNNYLSIEDISILHCFFSSSNHHVNYSPLSSGCMYVCVCVFFF